jgi:hypothetical protein
MAVTETRRSVPLLAGISMLAIGLAASPVAIDLHPIGLGKNAAFAQAAGGGDVGSTNQGGSQEMAAQQGAASQGSTTQPAHGQKMDRDTIRGVQQKLNQMGYHAGPEDGVMGPKTHKAIAAYQTKMGMHSDGKLTRDLADRIMAGT